LPKIVSIDAGIKVNVVPGKAKAVVAGLEAEVLTQAADAVEKQTGLSFSFGETEDGIQIIVEGKGAHASTPDEGNNALTGLLSYLVSLPLADCPQLQAVKSLVTLFPHGDTRGKAVGIAMEDELSGPLTLAFDMLTLDKDHLEGAFDCRACLCATEENSLNVIRARMAEEGLTLQADHMTAPHHVDGNSHFVKTLLKAYEEYTGLEGHCESTGGGTYVHHLENGVAFGASMPGTDNKMHGADEFAVIDELLTSAKIFAQVIVDLCC
ncbi:M20/M25/M40 family metallo-hydrolase, partial [Enterocloster sp.]